MQPISISDRGELVDLQHPDAQTFLGDALNWMRDFAAKGALEGANALDDWVSELDKLNLPVGGLKEYLQQQDNWVAKLFAEVLAVVEVVNPLTVGKQIAIWILEDFRDLLRALATLIDAKDDTAEETQEIGRAHV